MVALWFSKAYLDLRTANALLSLSSEHFESIVFHCQQAVEKSVKGYLVFNKVRFSKTHDIEKLLEQVAIIDSILANKFKATTQLTKYAVAYRYPEETEVLPQLERIAVSSILQLSERAYTEFKRKTE